MNSPVNSKQFYAEFIYLMAMGSQPFMYCWFGNEVTLKVNMKRNMIYFPSYSRPHFFIKTFPKQ
ncbi:hypothetical protein NQ314_001943 [Rhamnusium bicolor]|uniref:Uncharacterized protein n=1 Tax=Rhamnusium bicolor TaxID=1586634 RepID=A0AAV8ZQM3_9CUCU|nr:hypothetical protein NQ314_001943 [Rhamnusium bicolor]